MIISYDSRRSQPPILTPFTVPLAPTLQSKLGAPLAFPSELEPPTEISIEMLPLAPLALAPSAVPVWLTSGQSHGSLSMLVTGCLHFGDNVRGRIEGKAPDQKSCEPHRYILSNDCVESLVTALESEIEKEMRFQRANSMANTSTLVLLCSMADQMTE